jgi:hypothetical protein
MLRASVEVGRIRNLHNATKIHDCSSVGDASQRTEDMNGPRNCHSFSVPLPAKNSLSFEHRRR